MDLGRTRPPFASEVPQFVVDQEQAWRYFGSFMIADQLQIYLCGIVLGVASLSSAFSSSHRALKAFLAIIIIMNVAYTGCRAHVVALLAIEQHRDTSFVFSRIWLSEVLAPFPDIFIITGVQIFLAIRVIWILQRRLIKLIWLAVFSSLLVASLTGWTGAPLLGIKRLLGRPMGVDSNGPLLDAYGQTAYLFFAAAIDILISVTLATRLRRDILGFNVHTDSMIRRVIQTTLATCALTSVTASIAAAAAIMYATKLTANWVTEILLYPLPSLYCLSVFWTLNLRSRLRQERQGRDVEFSLAAPNFGLPDSVPERSLT